MGAGQRKEDEEEEEREGGRHCVASRNPSYWTERVLVVGKDVSGRFQWPSGLSRGLNGR